MQPPTPLGTQVIFTEPEKEISCDAVVALPDSEENVATLEESVVLVTVTVVTVPVLALFIASFVGSSFLLAQAASNAATKITVIFADMGIKYRLVEVASSLSH